MLILIMLINCKFALRDVYNGGGDSNDDNGAGDVGRVKTNGGDDTKLGNGDSKFDCSDDTGGGDGDDKDVDGVDDDGDVGHDIGNDANCGDGRSKVDCSKDTAVDDGNGKSDGGGDTNGNGKEGDHSDGESNDGAGGHKNDYDDGDGCLSSVKNCFKNKQIFLENFSLPDSPR